jgi:hypothetical protein
MKRHSRAVLESCYTLGGGLGGAGGLLGRRYLVVACGGR